MPDSIEQVIELDAPMERVWRAIIDHREFGEWFRVVLDAPFAVGETATGRITYPGYEHVRWQADVVTIEPVTRFAFTWHPYAVDPAVDYAVETPTLVEFRLAPSGTGTRLTITESGFDRIPAHRRDEAFRMNGGGWAEQARNIHAHVDG